jgi:hypothetical protein
MLLALIVLEAFKAVTRLAGLDPEINVFSVIFPAMVAVFTAVILILFVRGNPKAPILWYIIGALNIMAVLAGLYSVTLRIDIGMGMPVFLFYVYIILHIALAIVLGFYGWSLSQPTDEEKVNAVRKGKDFDSFLKR